MANPDIRIANNGISFFEYVLACVPSRAPTSMWNNPVPRYIYEKLNLRITMTVILTSQPALPRTCIELQVDTNQHIPTHYYSSNQDGSPCCSLDPRASGTNPLEHRHVYIANLSPTSLSLLERGDNQIQTSPTSFILPASQPSKEPCAANPHPKPAVRKAVLALWNRHLNAANQLHRRRDNHLSSHRI